MRDIFFAVTSRALKILNKFLKPLAISALTLALFLSSESVFAQDEKQDEENKFELSRLKTFLKSKDGSLIQYFNMTYEEFNSVYNALNKKETQEASKLFSIRSADVVTKIRSDSAEMELELNVIPMLDGTIEIPLGMKAAFFPQASRKLVRREDDYFIRLEVKKDKAETIKIRAIQNVKNVRSRKLLPLDLPKAIYTTIRIHLLEPDVVVSLDKESKAKTVSPFFSGGTSYEFGGQIDSATISWVKPGTKSLGNIGTISPNATLSALIRQNEIRYQAQFSFQSNDSVSSLIIGLPKRSTGVSANASGELTITRESEGQAWDNYQLEIGRSVSSLEDVQLQWTVPRSEQTMNLLGFEVFGFLLPEGLLTVKSEDKVSFVLADRFNLDLEDRVVANRHHTYSFSSLIFSASVFTILDSVSDQNRADLTLKLDSSAVTLDIDLPGDLVPENPAAVKLNLNGWKLDSGQENLTVDSLLQKVEVSPVFFLIENRNRRISLNMDSDKFGSKTIVFPRFENLELDQARLSISCSEDVIARLDRNQNPSLDFASQFETEVVSVGKSLVGSARSIESIQVKLRLEPVLPFIEGSRVLSLVESRGDFLLKSTCTIESSRVFDALAVRLHSNVESIQVNDQPVELTGQMPGQPFVIQMPSPSAKVVVVSQFEPDEWKTNEALSKRLTEFFLPRIGFGQPEEESEEIQGRNFGRVELESELGIVTSTGILVSPDSSWRKSRSKTRKTESWYSGDKADSLELSRSILSDEDVYVEQAWVHTSLNTDFRQDRVVIRFTPKRSVIYWQIPEGTRVVGCRLDGESLSSIVTANEGPLETAFDDLFEEHVIEFDLRFFHSSFESDLRVSLPKTSRILWCQHFYWSVQLPDSHYVLNYSNELTSSYLLNWTGFFLRPTPKLTPKQLERWIATKSQRQIDQKGNDYLFSSFGIVDDRSIYIVSKRNLVLIFGLVFISLGCAFVSLSFMRNSIFLVSIAAGILILGMWYPIWFVQLLQIEIFIGFLFGVGFVVSRFTNWLNPAKDETRIETNVPSLVLAAPDSGVEQSAETRRLSPADSERNQ